MRQTYSGYAQADRQRELRKLWRGTYDFVAPGKIVTADDPANGDFVITMTGSATLEWTRDQGIRWYEMDRSRLGWRHLRSGGRLREALGLARWPRMPRVVSRRRKS